jgi:tRNA (guanine-N7-)-methyltransferase
LRSRRRLPLEELAPCLFPDVPRGGSAPPIDWPAVFGNDRPVEIEVGFGKGLFLLTAGESHPDVNYFGIEIVRKYQFITATRLVEKKLANVKVACADAHPLLRDRVRPGSVQAVHVYFPDPWWKKRHHKRRLFTPEFAAVVGQVLRPTGRLHFATDVVEYFDIVRNIVQELPSFQPVAPPEPSAPKDELDYLTNFERKYRGEGRPIYRMNYVKR